MHVYLIRALKGREKFLGVCGGGGGAARVIQVKGRL